jgi:hypothetical protein
VQAIENIAPDLPLAPEEHPAVGLDDEYKRHKTLLISASLDLFAGDTKCGSVIVKRTSIVDEVEIYKNMEASQDPNVMELEIPFVRCSFRCRKMQIRPQSEVH